MTVYDDLLRIECTYTARNGRRIVNGCTWKGRTSEAIPVENGAGETIGHLCPVCRNVLGKRPPAKRKARK